MDTDYRRRKPGMKRNVNHQANGAQGPTSQIPGLSNSATTAPVEKTRGRRVGIFETDSDYVKLAKQGGQKGLLWHEETNLETKPNTEYKPPDWFSATDKEQKCMSKSTSPDLRTPEQDEDSPTKGVVLRPNAPFGSDDKSTWERDSVSFSSAREKAQMDRADPAAEELKRLSLTDQELHKYKRMSYDKKAAPVSMSKLLSFGYAEDKSPKDDDEESSVTSEQMSSVALDEDLE